MPPRRRLYELPDVDFSISNSFSDLLTPTVNLAMDYHTVLRDAFEKYIVNTPIESNTIGLQIDYLEHNNSDNFKSMYIVRRKYNSEEETKFKGTLEQGMIETLPSFEYDDYVFSVDDLNTFQNEEFSQVMEELSHVYLVYQIVLIEVYNDRPDQRNKISRRGWTYSTFTIPIRLLYRTDLLTERIRILHQNQQIGGNPNQLWMVRNITGLPPITSRSWPDQCIICLEEDKTGLCRVNCSEGHIFHCKCLQDWRNTKTNAGVVYDFNDRTFEGGWNDGCPLCRELITQVMKTEIPSDFVSSFGKRKNTLKQIQKDINYLKKLK